MTTAPKIQKLERLQTIEKEHKEALERAVSLNIPHATTSTGDDEEGAQEESAEACENESKSAQDSGGGTNWDEVVKKLMKRDESGKLIFESDKKALK